MEEGLLSKKRKQEAEWVWLVYSEKTTKAIQKKPPRMWMVYSVIQSIEYSGVNDPPWSQMDWRGATWCSGATMWCGTGG
jgi:hypothetical protein